MFKKSYVALTLLGISAAAIANNAAATTTTDTKSTQTTNTTQAAKSTTKTAAKSIPTNNAITPTGTPVLALNNIASWSVGLEGFYAQATSPRFQYAQITSNTTPTNDINNESVGNSYHAGMAVDATYYFAGTSRDATVAYTHVEMEDSSNAYLSGDETFADPFDLIPSRRSNVNQITGATDQNYNAIDMVLGQHFSIGDRIDLRPFGGIRYVDITSRDNSTYYNDPAEEPDTPIQATAQINSHYEGLGPRAGIDARVNVNHGLSIVGTFAGSLEIGYDNVDIVTQSEDNLPISTDLQKDWYVVPELDARLGLDFLGNLTPTATMDVQLGYQVVNYFNAVEENYLDISSINNEVSKEDFGYQGPYLRLQLNLA